MDGYNDSSGDNPDLISSAPLSMYSVCNFKQKDEDSAIYISNVSDGFSEIFFFLTVSTTLILFQVNCLKSGIVAVLNALPKGALKEGDALDGCDGDGAEGSDADGAGGDRPSPVAASGWTPALREAWQSHLASATRSQVLQNFEL